jgi:hypothetical protein
MKRIAIRRLAILALVVAALAAVALVAYSVGTDHRSGFVGMRGMGYGGGGMDWGYGPGFGLLGLLGFVAVGLLVVWLLAALLAPGSSGREPVGPALAGPAPAGQAPADVERLRELSEMHTRGELTDDEFTTAKRKLLGMQ